jgi:hypothetical protein
MDAAERERWQVFEIDAEAGLRVEERLMVQGFAVDERSVDVPGDRVDPHETSP